jgi:hypothetical protein
MDIIFKQGNETFYADGSSIRRVTVAGLGQSLPAGMFAYYSVLTTHKGKTKIDGTMQARARGGRRYFFDIDENDVQARLLKWAKRILRERGE